MQPNKIVFDLGNVVMSWDPSAYYRALLGEEQGRAFIAEICTIPWHEQSDRGKSIHTSVSELVAKFPDKEKLIRAFYSQAALEVNLRPIPETITLIDELKAVGRELCALSNFSTDMFLLSRPRFPVLENFNGIMISGELGGIAKPDPEIFQFFLKRFNLDAGDCLFIDDKKDNIKAARHAGFHTHHFTNAHQLRKHLCELKLL